jgi:hypothetical protein
MRGGMPGRKTKEKRDVGWWHVGGVHGEAGDGIL